MPRKYIEQQLVMTSKKVKKALDTLVSSLNTVVFLQNGKNTINI